MDEIKVGTGVRLCMADCGIDYATGFVDRVEHGLVGVWWMWVGEGDGPGSHYAQAEEQSAPLHWLESELVVMSQPDHDFWPSFWNNDNLWAFPESHVWEDNGEGFIARMQVFGAPNNLW